MMKVHVEVGGERDSFEYDDGGTVQDLIDDGTIVGTSATTLVNGRVATGSMQLRDGDVISQLPLQGKQG